MTNALDVQTPPGQTLSNWTIRLKHTPLANYGAVPAWETNGWTIAHRGSVTITKAGWVEFPFIAPFAYNGADKFLYFPIVGYNEGNHEVIRSMLTDDATILGLSDGGAHCSSIVDASVPS